MLEFCHEIQDIWNFLIHDKQKKSFANQFYLMPIAGLIKGCILWLVASILMYFSANTEVAAIIGLVLIGVNVGIDKGKNLDSATVLGDSLAVWQINQGEKNHLCTYYGYIFLTFTLISKIFIYALLVSQGYFFLLLLTPILSSLLFTEFLLMSSDDNTTLTAKRHKLWVCGVCSCIPVLLSGFYFVPIILSLLFVYILSPIFYSFLKGKKIPLELKICKGIAEVAECLLLILCLFLIK